MISGDGIGPPSEAYLKELGFEPINLLPLLRHSFYEAPILPLDEPD